MNDRDQRLKEVAGIAATLEKQTGCPAPLMIAQWAIESQWGAKPVGQFNFFGIKRAARHTKWCTVRTHEVLNGKSVVEDLEFADYDSLQESCKDYAWLITHGAPYQQAWKRYQQDKNLNELIAGVARIYATAPQYARLAEEIAIENNVIKALAFALVPPASVKFDPRKQSDRQMHGSG
jgi:flagellum-specific peptidoglycan hydrolase FlgJ